MSIQCETLKQPYATTESIVRRSFLGVPFDRVDQDKVVEMLRGNPENSKFRYIVTPNVDHVVRVKGNKPLLAYYDSAWLSVCDSVPISILARMCGLKLPLVTGSDLTSRVVKSVIQPGDSITLVASDHDLVRDMRRAYPDVRFDSIVPPHGVLAQPELLQECVEFVASRKARFVFLAIGSPQSEKIAHVLSQDSRATGVALCIGASLEFLLQNKKRAPLWMRRVGLEWLHRLVLEPNRLWRRYVYAVVPLMKLFVQEFALGRGRRADL
ncbi:glycosyl transferase [Mesorhizobium sp. Root157]|uniref:WecB/TagA/CpsF family glycosyltransferase n=1 Tax=Mesorhizobium sp. Root157 TaxID=1736477 RepID=UPI0006F597D0|nr:WecB/TagA/CpsF family glycosyltransferase [Mesorhizobium sp. Root157]KQZ93862.1 glycosyl transferase [Mesorhizobium sp. Root157]